MRRPRRGEACGGGRSSRSERRPLAHGVGRRHAHRVGLPRAHPTHDDRNGHLAARRQAHYRGLVLSGSSLTSCSECGRQVDEATEIAERWGYWSDGCGDLLPYCLTCAAREFGPDAPANALSHLVDGRVRRVPDGR